MRRRLAVPAILAAVLVDGGCVPPVYVAPLPGTVAPPALAAAARGTGPTLSVRALDDVRPMTQRIQGSSWIPDRTGWTGEAVTVDASWTVPPASFATRTLAAALSSTGRFARVLVLDPGAAAHTDLVLEGRLRRLKGVVRYHVARGEKPRIERALGDVFVDRIEVVERATGRLAFAGQAGAQLTRHPKAVDPYALARAAMTRAADDLAAEVAHTDLSHARLARSVSIDPAARGTLDSLAAALPTGWRLVTRAPSAPPGWDGPPTCRTLRLVDETRRYYNPSLGHYRASLDVWACPAGWAARLHLGDGGARYPAELLGRTKAGAPVFELHLGESTWKDAAPAVRRYLALVPPPAGPPVLRVP